MRTRPAFTALELLTIVAIIAILASVAIARGKSAREHTNVTTMMTDLRNLVTAQEAYFLDNNQAFAGNTNMLGTNYRTTTGVTVTITITGANTTGYSATASHAQTSKTCSISVGGTATNPGEPVCQ